MRRLIILIPVLLLGWPSSSRAQQIVCSPENKMAAEEKISEIRKVTGETTGDELTAIGKTFLGTPYRAQTLEGNGAEALVINLQGLDCTTFVENVLAFGLIRREEEPDFNSFAQALEEIRYRNGVLKGYGSRLHYFTEWISDNEAKGMVQNITAALGGEETFKELNFMSEHRSLYPALANNDSILREMKETETRISRHPLIVLPLHVLEKNEALIASGDIIALATSIEGLDVTHTGFAIRMPDNRIHLLHASSSGMVEISALPLTEYLKKISKNTGIIVARPVF